MTTHRIADLDGLLLDKAVALAENRECWMHEGRLKISKPTTGHAFALDPDLGFAPSRSWMTGGPIIEREHIAIVPDGVRAKHGWDAYHDASYCGPDGQVDCDGDCSQGPTPLIAAMRAYVASKFGETVDLP